ncbi:hypothetical protein [Streptomyces sp. DSM 118878]
MKFVRSAAVLVGAVTLCVTAVGTSTAASGAKASVSGATAVADIKWRGPQSISYKFKVTDTASDNAHAEGRMQVRYSNGSSRWSGWIKASGKNATKTVSQDATESKKIKSLRVQVCRVKGQTKQSCGYSSEAYNPYG